MNITSPLSPEELIRIEKRLLAAAKDNRIPCPVAFVIAEELGVAKGEVGKVANKLKIKISKCQLGCF